MMTPWLKSAMLPPVPFLAMALVGLLLARRRGDWGWWSAVTAVVALTLLAIPLVSATLIGLLETSPPLSAGQLKAAPAEAIAILSADAIVAPEYDGDGVGGLTLARLRYGAWVQRQTGLPLLVSGGTLPSGGVRIAVAMRSVLEDEFHVPVAWIEDRSQDTWENARFSAAILDRHGIRRVLLVTHAWHMPRARDAFERAGLEVVAAPTGFTDRPTLTPNSLIPSAPALAASYYALYEMLGAVYYRFAKS
jgi:uncharacterized SAM-binding protein YcdF (DUF218 family)